MGQARQTRAYGEWASPIPASALAEGARKIEQICLDGDVITWIEMRPDEGGRSAVMRWSPGGAATDVLPRWFDARTTVNSYGGGAMASRGGVLVFTQYSADAFPKTRDQRVHRQDPGALPVPITPPVAASYADLEIDPAQGVVYAVMEETNVVTNGQPTQSLIALDLAAKAPPRILAQGSDFYAAPRLSPDGRKLAWITWNYPSMPWEGTELWVADIDPSGALRNPHKVAGAPAAHVDPMLNPVLQRLMRFSDEAVVQPLWSPAGRLHAVSDRVEVNGDRWANICRAEDGRLAPVTREAAEFAGPAWQLGGSSYGFVSETEVVAAMSRNGTWTLVRVNTETGETQLVDTPFSSIEHLHIGNGAAVFVGASFTAPAAIYRMDLATGETELVRATRPALDEDVQACIRAPRSITFRSGPDGAGQSHAFHYAPLNPHFEAPEEEKPPVIVVIHGGPTGAAKPALDLTIPFFTSRGFAVLDVNYRGSTGFGRSFRRAIYGGWGKVDVEDCLGAVAALVRDGKADPHRVLSRGGSSGGYTTLALATFTDLLSAAASYYGISNLEMIARVTDKLEAHYAELLLGPYPSASKLFRERSPLFHAERIDCPIILFQGTEDPVVPPKQARVLIDEMKARGLPHAYEFYEAESHGFRRTSSIVGSVEEELSFYGMILGFTPDGPLKAPQLRNRGDADT
ncbi:Dipeptidyl aminopeptidase/acylaminoacyl peptidase [Tranquillimonas alkanivorans]|uniref:Dipeptidyl aminopeptidase/acylaminoacyl peptidase n=2 Tax=Tranquillimonas alkanivorans TaxID=441119 RepID=A0A1I5UGG0_9RHOB|nr:Dipeptidyl aminopeptidase/acylaminoacyl peptidase [Tranquillimonas alkanivorans]